MTPKDSAPPTQTQPQVLCLTTGEGGTLAQALGLAEALQRHAGAHLIERRFAIRRWARRLPAAGWHRASSVLPFWPEVALQGGAALFAPLPGRGPVAVIGAGRHAAPLVLELTRRLRGAGRRVASVMVLDPDLPFNLFDAVVLPQHDGLSGPNVLPVLGSLGRITAISITQEAARQAPRFAHLPQPRLAVLIGGPAREVTWTEADSARLEQRLGALVAAGWSLMITPSPRSDPALVKRLRHTLPEGRCWIWDGLGENPYPAILGLAKAVLVTEDSVNMVSEAAASGRPVHAFRLSGRHPKMDRFHAAMLAQGAVRDYDGAIGDWSYRPLAETDRIAALLAARHLTPAI
ncbi:mitochondrial fission ELM1 family protein [Salipiger sp. PrR002]|uniref:mitochondrial fission ELM1 family protein n=1 Tax=Salipiger sp. PrR002 TaxID=2706489 RepID=UPI0013B9B95C|nr:mitochondrial fission ELM1 family protein [Salipiger sp. PrR002]NDW00501.1 hypothetical protein [Salipiger sp. PrR002]NDW57670.1 hypothetical protein [Salipiger sp. PrR004]